MFVHPLVLVAFCSNIAFSSASCALKKQDSCNFLLRVKFDLKGYQTDFKNKENFGQLTLLLL